MRKASPRATFTVRKERPAPSPIGVVDLVVHEPALIGMRALGPALTLATAGGLMLAYCLPAVYPGTVAHILVLLVGISLLTAGLLWVVAQPLYAARSDPYVAIRVDSLAICVAGTREPAVFAWTDIDDVRSADAAQVLILDLACGDAITLQGPFEAINVRDLAARIRRAKQLAAWGRLAPESELGP